MAMQRYDRNSTVGLTMPTVNPCNNFIIDYLIRTKIKSDKQVSSKYYMYNLAIQSVRKYPLPLICEEQLAALQGFGNFFIKRVAKLMKKHYQRGRMANQEQMEEDDKQHLEGIRQNLRRLNLAKRQKEQQDQKQNIYQGRKKMQEQSYDNDHEYENSDQQYQKQSFQEQKKQDSRSGSSKNKTQQTLKFEKIMFEQYMQRLEKQKNSQEQNPKSTTNRSSNLKKKRKNYRPKRGTEPFEILKAILQIHKKGKRSILKGDINQYMFNLRKQKMKGWTPVRERLIEFGYLNGDPQNQDLVTLTEKGQDYVQQVEKYDYQDDDKRKRKKIFRRKRSSQSSSGQDKSQSQKEDKNPIKSNSISVSISKSNQKQDNLSFKSQESDQPSSDNNSQEKRQSKQNKKDKQRPKSKPPRSESSRYSNSSYTKSKGRHRGSGRRSQRIRFKPDQKFKKEHLSIGKIYKQPTLIVNSKSETNTKDQQRIFQLLDKLDNFDYKEEPLSFGQFAWETGQMLLDFIVFRVKCETFDLDEFFLLCQRAKHSQCQNIFFIFQQTLPKPKNQSGKEQLICSVIADTRVAGFKVVRTSSILQTISFIIKASSQLGKKVKAFSSFTQVKPMYFLSSIEQFNERSRSYKPSFIRNVTISCLKCIPNMSRQMIKKIIKVMPGMWYLYNKLSKLRNSGQRKNFLLWYLKEFNPKKGTIRLIVDLMYFTDYNDE